VGTLGQQVLQSVASVLSQDTFDLNVEGYTDDAAITGGPWSTNEELSAVRAVNVELLLENPGGINPDRLSATGFGSTHPVAPNDTPAHMSLNRRIDIVVLSPTTSQP
jgi:chemotaxis protein MotB